MLSDIKNQDAKQYLFGLVGGKIAAALEDVALGKGSLNVIRDCSILDFMMLADLKSMGQLSNLLYNSLLGALLK